MALKRIFVIDGANFEDFAGFITEFNSVYISAVDGFWTGNLDAFNDYLSWHEKKYILKWANSQKSRRDLGYTEMVIWLERNLLSCHASNRASVARRLRDARRKTGQTFFDMMVEIIEFNTDYAELRLE